MSLKTLQERIAKTDRPPRKRIESSANEETKFARERAVGPPPTTVRGTIKPRRAAAHERERGTRPRGGRRHPGVASIVFHDEAAELVGPVGPAGGFERAAIHPGAVWMSLDHREASSSRLHLRRCAATDARNLEMVRAAARASGEVELLALIASLPFPLNERVELDSRSSSSTA